MHIEIGELKSKSNMKLMADAIENYVDVLEEYIIVDGITEEEYKDAIKTVRKLIKKLRDGDRGVFVDNLEEVVADINEDYPF